MRYFSSPMRHCAHGLFMICLLMVYVAFHDIILRITSILSQNI